MEYRIDCESIGMPKLKVMPLLEFRMKLGEALLSTPNHPEPDYSAEDIESQQRRCQKYRANIPVQDKRLDGYQHWIIIDDIKNARMCRIPSCTSRTRNRCKKCDVNLCNTKDNHCFELFHTVKDILEK